MMISGNFPLRHAVWYGVAAFAALFVGVVLSRADYDVQGVALVAPALGVLAFLILPRLAGREDKFLLTLLVAGLAVKIGAAFLRLYVAFDLYGGNADAVGYDETGTHLAQALWRLDFAALAPYLSWGTEMMGLSTGLIYAVIGPTLPGAYIVYAFLAFLGSFLCYRAFCIAFPGGNRRAFALMVFFFPTIAFWPNGMSKDALMFFFMGVAVYGAARSMSHATLGGWVALVSGLFGMLMIRPHISGILAISFAVPFGLSALGGVTKGSLAQLAGLVIACVVAWFFVPRALDYVGLSNLDPRTALDYLDLRQTQTFQGGSQYAAPSLTTPLGGLTAFVTVLFRPFPWETHNVQALAQGLDGLLLLGVALWCIPSVIRSIRSIGRYPFVALILIYTVLFIVAFTSISNFGILARQRAQLLPLFMMLLVAVPSMRTQSATEQPSRVEPSPA